MSLFLLGLCLSLVPQDTSSGEQSGFPGLGAGRGPRVEIAWNRLYDYDQIFELMDKLVEKYPALLSYQVIGSSVEEREMRVYTLHNQGSGSDLEKPAMWVDGNVHGNEVQGGEAVVYLAWYLLENYGSNERVTDLVDHTAFYLLPMVNPDGRASWFQDAHSANSSRSGVMPLDRDLDGLADEDGPDDLNGDGSIVMMRKYTPGRGTHRLNADDDRILERVPRDAKKRGDWKLLGREGIDNDGDGRVNEDGRGGYDMNRSWPATWMPDHVQYGAGPYPLYWPETRSIANFIYYRPNIAAIQSFHNAGGMILRGPGAEVFGEYPSSDLRVYDSLGKQGEKMLPFYRYMIIWKDLYSVFGGFVTWGYESLGIISFTNELWTDNRNSPDDRLASRSRKSRHFFDDHLLAGAGFADWEPFEHPLYGSIEIGGFKKDVGRVPPSFLIEEMVHRNALFCILHAEAMPRLEMSDPQLTNLGRGAHAIDLLITNKGEIPTRTAISVRDEMGSPDLAILRGEGIEVLAGGFRSDEYRPEVIDLQEHPPWRLVRDKGIGGLGELRIRWIVKGSGTATIRYQTDKALDLTRTIELP